MAVSVDQLLQDEGSRGVAGEGGDLEDLAEGGYVAVQVADDHDVVGRLERDHTSPAARGGPEQVGRAADDGEQLLGVWHRNLERVRRGRTAASRDDPGVNQ